MKRTVTCADFRDALRDHNCLDNFSCNGARALFLYLEELEADIDGDFELDVIALCCNFTEYEDARQCVLDAGYMFSFADKCGYDATYDDENEEIGRAHV